MVTTRIMERPLLGTPRRNAEGLWRCCRCQAYLPASAFYPDRFRSNTPGSRCKPCGAAKQREWINRKALDDDWWAAHMARRRAYPRGHLIRAKQARRERGQLARVLLEGIVARGLALTHVTDIASIHFETQRRIMERGELAQQSVLDRLVVLHQVCREVPAVARKRGTPHPHLAEIARRYQAVREAHA